ncbi:MAG: flavin reductase family protein [Candidatus Bathyarchaeia archaeon]
MEKVQVEGRLFYRLMYPRPTILVTCVDPSTGRPNIITLAWSTPLSFTPSLVGISISPQRYSHDLIAKTGEFVVNIPTAAIAAQALICGRISGREVDKFQVSGLTPKPSRRVRPPIINECAAHLECRVVNSITTGDHTLFVGEILAAYANKNLLRGGLINNEKFRALLHLAEDHFTTTVEATLTPKI